MLPQAPDSWSLTEAAHLLNRAGFGGAPDAIRSFHSLGRHRAIDSLLHAEDTPDAFPLPDWMKPEQIAAERRERFEMVQKARMEMQGADEGARAAKRKEIMQMVFRRERERGLEAQGWWGNRTLKTQAPLREKMTLFWHNHYATSIQKVKQPALMLRQNELFRTHAFGNFKTLTHEIARDPAMMLYLDMQTSKKGHPNENFAREVMELFTLGAGHYTEEDIRQAARAFTGYQLDRLTGAVTHNLRQWDEGPKTFLGKTGDFKGDDIINVIFGQPQAARFITAKIWKYFVSDELQPAVHDELAAALRGGGYAIAPLLRGIFGSAAFYDKDVIRCQIKCPVQFLVQSLKQLEVSDPPRPYLSAAQFQLGQVLFMPPNVAGWDWGKAWINTSTLLARYQVSGVLSKGSQAAEPAVQPAMMMEDGKKNAMTRADRVFGNAARFWKGPDYETIAPAKLRTNVPELVASLTFRFFQDKLPDLHRERFEMFAKDKSGATLSDHDVAQLVHLMMSTPYYQLT